MDEEDLSSQYLILPVVSLDSFTGDRGGLPKSGGKVSRYKLRCVTNVEDIIPEVSEPREIDKQRDKSGCIDVNELKSILGGENAFEDDLWEEIIREVEIDKQRDLNL